MDERIQAITDIPLVVDLDGTLVKVNTLHEAFVQLSSQHPQRVWDVLCALGRGRAAFKAAVADHVIPDARTLPFDDEVLAAVKAARDDGRKVYLATAADRRVAAGVAEVVGEFDGIFASEDGMNLKGQAKADRLVAVFGERGFDYIGNERADLPVWRAARTALIAGASSRLVHRLAAEMPNAIALGTRAFNVGPYLSALRPHQWLKNALVALPAIAGHDFRVDTAIATLIAFVSFSLLASAGYIVNDMLDVRHDRTHRQKRNRPLAAGDLALSHASVLACGLGVAALTLALLLPWTFILVLGGYLGLSLLYSVYLKRKLMIDVVALAGLYGVRVIAGGVAVGIALSDWLVGFCFFIFLSLALMKRTTELMLQPEADVGKIKGRGYRRVDLPTINALTVGSGLVAVLVLALYINSPQVKPLYERPEFLWGICVVLVYWLGRAFFLTGRGEMQQDPVIFAATDWISLLTGVVVAALFVLAL